MGATEDAASRRPAPHRDTGVHCVRSSNSLTPDERLRRYAELAVRVGANVQEGQDAIVSCLVEHVEIARAIAREAYRAGARHVIVNYGDLHLRRAAIELGPEEELGWSAPHLLELYRRAFDEHPALIALTGNPDPDLLGSLDPALVGRSEPKEIRKLSLELIAGRRINWTVVSAPNEGWATQVFREPDLERLWDAVAVATRLDAPDLVAAWRAHAAELQSRAEALNARAFDAVRFRGPGTDLTNGLIPDGRWMCATNDTVTGIEHIPNLPTEEVFTSPDWRRAEATCARRHRCWQPGRGSMISRCASRAARSRRSPRRPAATSSASSSGWTSRRRFSPRSRSSTAPPPSRRRGSSSTTRSSTRTRRVTSRTAAASRPRSARRARTSRPTSFSAAASTSRPCTRT